MNHSDFIFWNLVAVTVFLLWRILMWLLPRGVTFAVVGVSHSRIHGWVGTILINDRQLKVFRTGHIWRYAADGKILPDEWQEELENETT